MVSTKQQTKWNGSQQTSYHYLLDCTRKTLETLHSNFPSPAQLLQQFNTTHQNTYKFPRPNQPYPWFHSIWFSCVSNSKPFFHSFPNAFRHWNSLVSFPYIWKSIFYKLWIIWFFNFICWHFESFNIYIFALVVAISTFDFNGYTMNYIFFWR